MQALYLVIQPTVHNWHMYTVQGSHARSTHFIGRYDAYSLRDYPVQELKHLIVSLLLILVPNGKNT